MPDRELITEAVNFLSSLSVLDLTILSVIALPVIVLIAKFCHEIHVGMTNHLTTIQNNTGEKGPIATAVNSNTDAIKENSAKMQVLIDVLEKRV